MSSEVDIYSDLNLFFRFVSLGHRQSQRTKVATVCAMLFVGILYMVVMRVSD